MDIVIQVQEAMHSIFQRKEKGMLIKLDIENAFDRVNHSFLYSVLRAFVFFPAFINLIKACINIPWIAPLVNGRPTNFFQATRGLRQGCPLSSFLYILMADSLIKKLTKGKNDGSIPDITLAVGVESINHALFADDTLLLGGASLKMTRVFFPEIMHQFCIISGALITTVRVSSLDGM